MAKKKFKKRPDIINKNYLNKLKELESNMEYCRGLIFRARTSIQLTYIHLNYKKDKDVLRKLRDDLDSARHSAIYLKNRITKALFGI